jgi:hypothetical protein
MRSISLCVKQIVYTFFVATYHSMGTTPEVESLRYVVMYPIKGPPDNPQVP